MLPILLILDKL